MRVTALDLATTSGVCFGEAGAVPSFATWDFRKILLRGERALFLLRSLNTHIKDFQPEAIFIEKPLNARTCVEIGATEAVVTFLNGLVMVAEMCAASHGVHCDSTHSPQDARKHFVGRAKFSGKDEGKKASFERARMLRWPVSNLDEADAAALWSLGCATVQPNAWMKALQEAPARVR